MGDKRTYEDRKAYFKTWREKNVDKKRVASKRDYEKHKEARQAKNRKWSTENKEHHRELNVANYYKSTTHLIPQRERADIIKNGIVPRFRWYRHPYLTTDEIKFINEYVDIGPCCICGLTGKMEIDHCHKETKFRGLLCHNCNTMLGHAKDSIDVLKKAIEYLER